MRTNYFTAPARVQRASAGQGRRGLIVLLAALAGALGTARLGLWQLDRAAHKTAAHEAMLARAALPPLQAASLARTAEAAEQQLHRRVQLEGRWLGDYSIYLDNRQMNGHPGFFLVTPLLVGRGDVVLVQRGWLPRHQRERTQLAPVDTPEAPVRIEGRVAQGLARLYEFDSAASGPIRQNLDLAGYAHETGLPLRPLVVVQLGADGGGLQRQWAPVAADVSKHHGYAAQWFALSALITGLYVWFQLIRPRRGRAR
jgi:surfeit locus 1 family protein